MDDLIDPFLSSPSWMDMNASGRPSWARGIVSQASSLLVDPVGAYEGDEKDPSACMISSNHIVGNMIVAEPNLNGHDDTSSVFLNGNLKHGLNKVMDPTKTQLQHEVPNSIQAPPQVTSDTHQIIFSSQAVIGGNSTAEPFGMDVNNLCSVTLHCSALTDSGSIDSSATQLTAFPQSIGDSYSISSVPEVWPTSYSGVTSLLMGQGKLQSFGLQGVENDGDISTKACIGNKKFPQVDFPATSDQNVLCTPSLNFFTTTQQMQLAKTDGIQPHQQLAQSIGGNNFKQYATAPSSMQTQYASANTSGCNGAAKPRVRARRGQATDPHSIAERLRREKIAERMKSLQELVPTSNKTDKASMLDEIIDYVKFLQLQVKILSMSRLGAAGAVVPLITDLQAEQGSGNLPSAGQGATELSESQDNLAFEQDVVKLMEANVTSAMQYLQNKGLCLMPIALASAISSQKGSSAAIPSEQRKPSVPCGQNLQNSHSTERNGRDDTSNGCNGSVVKQEESPKSMGSTLGT